jgi:hypothetical protein
MEGLAEKGAGPLCSESLSSRGNTILPFFETVEEKKGQQ